MRDDRRLIEDLIPIQVINKVAQGEERGHLATHPRKLHRWWARRPLAAARAAVYATLLRTEDTPDESRSAAYFRQLCSWPAHEPAITQARARVLTAYDGVPPRILDLFAGGGAIPLEAARLGCETTAVELNPVAHLIERCMLDYPQRFGPSLGNDIRRWGERWVAQTWKRVHHLYPPVGEGESTPSEQLFGAEVEAGPASRAARRPIGYFWTRTVPCPNPALGAHELALVRQTWLAKKKTGRYIALRPRVNREALRVDWEVADAAEPAHLSFDPAGFSKRGASTCLVCGATVDGEHIKAEGCAGRMGIAPLAAVTVKPGGRGRDYFAVGDFSLPSDEDCDAVLAELDVEPPEEPLPEKLTGGMCTLYGLTHFRDLFTPRQLATLCAFAQGVRETYDEMLAAGVEAERAEALAALLALTFSRLTDFCTTLCIWHTRDESLQNTYRQQALPMVWDFVEGNPFGGAAGDAATFVESTAAIVESLAQIPRRVEVARASATRLPYHDGTFDAVITDPPYYDNISYSDLSDFFYVWLKRSVGFLFPEHLEGELTPKHREAIVAPYRHGGDKNAAREFYEREMAWAFAEAHRVLKPSAPLVCVYAHKTTLGWASLVESLRRARFMITEAWPLDTEMTTALKSETSSLASSIFLVARRRDGDEVGQHAVVRRELDESITERLERLVTAGVTGSDLVIAAIGAGLRPFTRYASVEYPNGEQVPAERFLEDVQARVLNAVLAQVHGLGDGVGGIDVATRYYVIARYSFGYSDVEFDEANNLARTAGVELGELANGSMPLASISKGKVRLLDFEARGEEPALGIEADDGGSPRLIDGLHGLLWRAAHDAKSLRTYLDEARLDPPKLRLVTQALQGKGLSAEGEQKPAEARACERLLGGWRTLVEDNLLTSR